MPVARPNILWICTDQQRFDTIGALGNAHARTPNLDRLAREGAALSHAYCQSPICLPSRASFMTGMYPSAIHVLGNGHEYFPPEPPLVSRLLADGGYDCGLIGKLHITEPHGAAERRADDGFRYWQYSPAPHYTWEEGHDYAQWVRSRGKSLKDLIANDGVPPELNQTSWCGEKTLEFVADASRPWLACLNFFYPHPPFNPPDEYLSHFDPGAMPPPLYRDSDLERQRRLAPVHFQRTARPPHDLDLGVRRGQPSNYLGGRRDAQAVKAAYYAMIEMIDEQIGRILDLLERTGQRERTLIVFTSDHGEMLGDHGLLYKGCRFYEGLVRVPLIFSWLGQIRESLVGGLTELIDIAPTLLECAGLEIPQRMQGRSLWNRLTGREDVRAGKPFVRCEYYAAEHSSACRDGPYATMYRDNTHKIVCYHGLDLGELYDLNSDPAEFHDLWDEASAQALKLRLLQRSFDATVLAMDQGPRRVDLQS